jgi:DNA-directed RNA polymerase beta' subunit
VIADIEKLIQRTQPFNRSGGSDKNYDSINRIWATALRLYLAPHIIITKENFSRMAWSALCEVLLVKNWKAWAVPGELVGIVAAQSIGEPATQMSAHSSTEIVVNICGKSVYKGKIGPFIDTLLNTHSNDVITAGHDSVILDLDPNTPIEILGVSANEKTSWRRISQISRHPANGGMVEVHTRTGRKTIATLSHSFLKRSRDGIVPVLGSDLKVGMRIPIATRIDEISTPTRTVRQGQTTFVLDKAFGWLCGIYLADGSLSGNTVRISKIAPIVETNLQAISEEYNWEFTTRHYQGQYGPSKDNNMYSKDLKDFLLSTFGEGSYTKHVGGIVFGAPLEFIQGVLGGYFDGDGNISVERQLIRVGSRSEKLIRDMNKLLGYCEMFGVLGSESSVRIPNATLYTLTIPKKFASVFKKQIGFQLEEKAEGLNKIIEYNEREDTHSQQEMIDKIPELGGVIAQTGKLLRMPGQSRTFGRWTKKESIGRRTLQEYIEQFKEMMAVHIDEGVVDTVNANIQLLESALHGDVLWDEIVELIYLDDPKEYVYDFTVPGNDSFMVDDNILVHNTLNTFHQAGVASKSAVTRGVPRLKELLRLTKNPKAISLTIYLKKEFREEKDRAREVTQDLELTLLRDLVKTSAIYYDPEVDGKTTLEEDKELLDFYDAFTDMESMDRKDLSKWVLRLEFDREKMFNKNILMDDVAFVVKEKLSATSDLIYSDFNSSKLIMRIRPSVETTVMGDQLAAIKKYQISLLNNTIVRGLAGLRAVNFRQHKTRFELQDVTDAGTNRKDKAWKEITQYVLETDGSNFLNVLQHPAVDGTMLYSTNIYDIYLFLGVEAARNALYQEISTLFSQSDINYRHLGLLCDVMSHSGKLMSVDRYGINKQDSGPLAKACFEETEKVLLKAALFGEMDPVTGVSANIMTGQTIRAGTAYSQVLLDEQEFFKLMSTVELEQEEEDDEVIFTDENVKRSIYEMETDACATIDERMNLVVSKPNLEGTAEDEEEEELEFNVK